MVIGEASIKIDADTRDLKRDITRALNDALGDLRINTNPLKGLNQDLNNTEGSSDRAGSSLGRLARETGDADRETNNLRNSMTGLHTATRGLGAAVSFLMPSMNQASIGGRILTTTLMGMTQASAVALAGMGAFAGAGGLVALGGALSQAAGAALLLPAALGAAGIAMATLTIGFQGMGDAFKAMGDPAKFAEAIKDLSPNARAFAVAVHDMVPVFKELRKQVQDRLFAGLGKDFSDLGKIYLPIVQQGLTRMAAGLNETARGFVSFARDKQTVADLGTLFNNSAVSMHLLSDATKPLLGALRDIGTVGSSFLPALAEGVTDVATRFGTFIAHARETGQLKEWISSGLSALGDIFKILGNIGSIISSIFKAGQGAGVGFLNTAKEVTGQLAAWAKSAEGQSAFVSFLTAAKQVAMALLPLVGAVVNIIAHDLAPVLAQIAGIVGPAVTRFLESLSLGLREAAPGISALARGFANFLEAVAPALPAIGHLVSVLAEGLGQILTALGPIIAEVARALAGELAGVIPPLVPVIITIVRAFGDLLLALIPIIPALVQLLGPFVEAGGIIDALVPIVVVLVEAFGQLVTALAPVVTVVADLLVGALNTLAPVFPVLTDAILRLAPAILELAMAFAPLIPPLIELIAVLLPPLIQILVALLVPTINVATAITGVLVPALVWLLETTVGIVSGVVNWFSNMYVNVLSITAALRDFVLGTWNLLKDVVTGKAREIADGVRNGLSSIGGLFSNAFNAASSAVWGAFGGIKNAVSDGINTVVAWTGGMGGRIAGAVGDLGRLLYQAGVRVITGLLDGIKSAAQNVYNFVSGIGSKIASLKGPIETDKRLLVPAGLAIMAGLHQALSEGFRPVEEMVAGAAGRLSDAFGAPILGAGVLASQLPTVRPGGTPVPVAGGDGAASPVELHEAILAAISDWQVVISARETASAVNRVNSDNRGR